LKQHSIHFSFSFFLSFFFFLLASNWIFGQNRAMISHKGGADRATIESEWRSTEGNEQRYFFFQLYFQQPRYNRTLPHGTHFLPGMMQEYFASPPARRATHADASCSQHNANYPANRDRLVLPCSVLPHTL
jgi:hypothetical protein